jgi:hypothetical protein
MSCGGANLAFLAGVIYLCVAKAFEKVAVPEPDYIETSGGSVLVQVVLNSLERVVLLVGKRMEVWRV